MDKQLLMQDGERTDSEDKYWDDNEAEGVKLLCSPGADIYASVFSFLFFADPAN